MISILCDVGRKVTASTDVDVVDPGGVRLFKLEVPSVALVTAGGDAVAEASVEILAIDVSDGCSVSSPAANDRISVMCAV